jgi:hypothetical protein
MKKFMKPNSRHQAGFSAQASYRNQRTRLRTLTIKQRVLSLAGIAVLAGGLGFAIGVNPLLTSGAAVIATVVASLAIMSPNKLIMLGTFFAYATAGLIIAPMFAFSASPTVTTLQASSIAVIGLWLAAAAAFWVSIKFSRRAPWITYLLALVGSVVFGGILIIVEPQLGMFALYFTMAVILIWRSVVGEWVKGSFSLAYFNVRNRIKKEPLSSGSSGLSAKDLDDEWLRRAEAEKRTAKILNKVDEIVVFHDRQIGKSDAAIPHIIVGPTGVIIAASILTDEKVVETAAFGIELSDVPLGYVASNLVQIRDSLASVIKVASKDIAMVIILHSTASGEMDQINRRIGVFTNNDGLEPSSNIRLLGSDSLPSEFELGFESISKTVQKAIIARIRMRLHAARPSEEGTFAQLEKAVLGIIDIDGRVVRPHAVNSSSYSALGPGVLVSVKTEDGTILNNIVVVSTPYLNSSGQLVVDLAVAEDYEEALSQNIVTKGVPFRVDSIKER